MSFYKFTSVSGNKADGSFHCVTVNGHWNIRSAIKRARMSNLVGDIHVEHCVADMSGKGRGGHDGRWIVNANDEPTKVAKWSEFGKEHA